MPEEKKKLNLIERSKVEKIIVPKLNAAKKKIENDAIEQAQRFFKQLREKPSAQAKKLKKDLEETQKKSKELNKKLRDLGYIGLTYSSHNPVLFQTIDFYTLKYNYSVSPQTSSKVLLDDVVAKFPKMKEIAKKRDVELKKIEALKDKLQMALYVDQTELESVVKGILAAVS